MAMNSESILKKSYDERGNKNTSFYKSLLLSRRGAITAYEIDTIMLGESYNAEPILHQASRDGDLQFIRILLSLGANPNITDNVQYGDKRTVLEQFCYILSDDLLKPTEELSSEKKRLLSESKRIVLTLIVNGAAISEDSKVQSVLGKLREDAEVDELLTFIETNKNTHHLLHHALSTQASDVVIAQLIENP